MRALIDLRLRKSEQHIVRGEREPGACFQRDAVRDLRLVGEAVGYGVEVADGAGHGLGRAGAMRRSAAFNNN